MLRLENIVKSYVVGSNVTEALRGVSIDFRESEFVAILGPSGCGKTTLLNIIGGLDRYAQHGDLRINNVSTKMYTERDWDKYRNHSVGFVFQNYNLIPHQTILANVELALTLSGIPKSERRRRAVDLLKKVGLSDHIYKKPNQLSGGQMQRVAIARALINNPSILLADEPTGALDTDTSVQIMDILRDIAKDKLVIMVTHNTELAENYANRVIRLVDGVITSDSNPYKTPVNLKPKPDTDVRKTTMSFFTALSLSLNNLMTKKGRTVMTAFAGSIGIIGIALIMSLSNGIQNYIDYVQENTLASYPVTIESESIDMSSIITSMSADREETDQRVLDRIYTNTMMADMLNVFVSKVQTNNLKALRKFIEGNTTDIKSRSTVQYSYDVGLNIYTYDKKDGAFQVNPDTVFNSMFGDAAGAQSSAMASMAQASQAEVFTEIFSNQELLDEQYEVVTGKWPTKYNELVLIVNENNEVQEYVLYALGLKDQDDLPGIMQDLADGVSRDVASPEFSYEEFMRMEFKLVTDNSFFSYDTEEEIWVDKRNDEDFVSALVQNGIDLRIVGIVRPQKDSVASAMTGAIGYSAELAKYIIDIVDNSSVVKAQRDNHDVDIFTGREFGQAIEDYRFTIKDLHAYFETLSEDEYSAIEPYIKDKSDAELLNMFEDKLTVPVADSTYEDNLKRMGVVDYDSPDTINIYPIDFTAKDYITDEIERYNEEMLSQNKKSNVITYTDYAGIVMSSISTIINVISYVLIAFVAVSLVVSSIMIGIITYVSVIERTKEIGILRAIGASKRDISRVFNAETLIIGLTAGVFGIGLTLVLIIPINSVIRMLADIDVAAQLPPIGAAILVGISMLLTIFAGLIPSGVAAKKDPIVALRSE